MTITKTSILRGYLSCASLVACTGDDGDTAGTAMTSTSTSTTTSTSTSTLTTDESATSTATSTGTSTATSTTSDGQYPCGEGLFIFPCDPGYLCVNDGGIPSYCLPNPDGCEPDDPCSPACRAICKEAFPTNDICQGMPGYLYCLACDIWGDSLCPDGSKCMPWAYDGGDSYNATTCSPLDPIPGKPGDPCTVEGSGHSGVDSCEAGAMCWNVDAQTLAGTCVGFCDGYWESPTCAEPGTVCVVFDKELLALCLPSCDPLLQDCPNGDLCTDAGEGFVCVPDVSGDTGVFADPCSFLNECDPGLTCLYPEYIPGCQDDGCCTPFCELDKDYEPIPAPAPNCPDPQMACLNWFEAGTAPAGQEKVGICGIPP